METSSPFPDQDLHHQTQLQASLIELAYDAMIVRDPMNAIVFWNRGAEELYGWMAHEAIGKVIHELLQTCFPDSREGLERFLATGEQWEGELVQTCKDGTQVIVESRQVVRHDDQQSSSSTLEIDRDITERKRREQENQEQFLTQVSKEVSSTLDYQETLANISRLVVPQLADWFVVDLVDAEGHFERVELAHIDPQLAQQARLLRQRYPIDYQATNGLANVVRSGQSELYSEISDDLLVASSRNEEELALSRQVGYSSLMIVPLVARGKTIGAVSFVATRSGKHYGERDLAFAEEVGRRAGVALDNARLYREIQQSRDQLDIILQGVADGILAYGPDSRVIYANEAAALMCGYRSVQEMQATPPFGIAERYELIDQQGHTFPRSQLTHLRVFAGEPQAQAIMGYRERGTGQPERWSLVTSRPVLGESEEVVMVVTITQDITERIRVERSKDEFISMTSHELKTPVTSLKGFTNVLLRRLTKQGDEQGLYYLTRMDAQLNRLTALISDLLDISRMQSGKLAFRARAFDLDKLIDEIVENVQTATTTHRLLIEGKTGAQVMGDHERLGQVFTNLLTNATKYSPKAEKVLVCLSQDGEQAIVSIQDFGIGIDKAHHEKIFERFYQVTDPEEKTYPGLGIGLYICHEIVLRHQGRMWVESSKGKGATFFVALPALTLKETDQATIL